MATDPGVEGARELTRRVVPHHQPYLVPTRFERFGLELGVLDDGAQNDHEKGTTMPIFTR